MRKSIAILILAGLLVAAGGAAAQDRKFMIGLMAPQINLGGSHFNGDNYFDLGNELILIPKVDSAWGWGIMAGFSADEFDGEFYYMQASPKAYVLTVPQTASFGAIGVNWRWYLTDPGVIRPYLNIAIDFSFLTVPRAAVQADYPYREGDAKFHGIGICGGGGLAISPFPRLTFFAGPEFRWNPMGQVKGLEGDFQKTKDLASTGLGFRVGTVFRF